MNIREHQAETARRVIRDAALQAFLEMGYLGTTMTDIAERGGVARQTVYNLFGSKAELLISVIEDRVVASEERSQAADHERVLTSSSPVGMIEAFAAANAQVATRALPIMRLAYEASVSDGDVAKQLEINEERRHEAQSFFVAALAQRGWLRQDMPIEELQRGFWLLASPRTLVASMEAGWDIDTYTRWLTESTRGLLLPRTTDR